LPSFMPHPVLSLPPTVEYPSVKFTRYTPLLRPLLGAPPACPCQAPFCSPLPTGLSFRRRLHVTMIHNSLVTACDMCNSERETFCVTRAAWKGAKGGPAAGACRKTVWGDGQDRQPDRGLGELVPALYRGCCSRASVSRLPSNSILGPGTSARLHSGSHRHRLPACLPAAADSAVYCWQPAPAMCRAGWLRVRGQCYTKPWEGGLGSIRVESRSQR